MKPKHLYLTLCPLGALLPYWMFVPWVAEHGLNLRLLIQELFANRISAFFGVDVIVSAVVLMLFIRMEGSRLGIRRCWLPVVATSESAFRSAYRCSCTCGELKSEQGKSLPVASSDQ